ncbi:Histidine--tRNA ligase [Andreprevotia sp. IGB-42]|uniref:ATP phosphoribosyltransferase regulatory subunit n=1 Tax=Andreprevotia sp. IGB-42 TaxID=2497473 RepID=UPI00135701A4|nr:ATP phosphoribosyltransferase regulatory subunit [Andreprevotia sp. IGB-42]KAF0811447.1 Histidine--tRNA ligase [Andreprevotia sp. IGB-42]
MIWRPASGAAFIEAGAEEAILPALWQQDTFINKAGGSEIIGQMWAFADKKGRACCLIPEATAIFQERASVLLGGARERLFFYIARCYRYERPQAGRYREFTQLGFEYLGPDPARASAFSLQLCQRFMDTLGVDYETDARTRRGLSYYLGGEGFEIRCPVLGAQKQVAGGGAYAEGAGFAIGLERLALAIEHGQAGCA